MALLMLGLFCLVLNYFDTILMHVCLKVSFLWCGWRHHNWRMQTCCSQKVPFCHNRIFKSQLIFILFFKFRKKVEKQLRSFYVMSRKTEIQALGTFQTKSDCENRRRIIAAFLSDCIVKTVIVRFLDTSLHVNLECEDTHTLR